MKLRKYEKDRIICDRGYIKKYCALKLHWKCKITYNLEQKINTKYLIIWDVENKNLSR